MSRIVLLRHGEAEKNVESRHGGAGTQLTAAGLESMLIVADFMANNGVWPSEVISAPRPQCEQSAAAIAPRFGVTARTDSQLEPYDLGVLDGLSDDEARRRYPAVAARMDSWRRGECEINALQIPGAGDPYVFFHDAVRSVEAILSGGADVVVLGTR